MNWGEFFSTYANERDVKELRSTQRRFRMSSYKRRREQGHVDQKQDAKIEALEHENDDLKLSLCALVAALQRSGQLQEGEAMEIIQPILEPLAEGEGA